jgi:2,5-diketo-D-gluconate reductase B
MQSVFGNGAHIPVLGFGTYGMRGTELQRMTARALHAGFRHIDTAQVYGNEGDVGEGVVRSGIARGEIFITTKVWVDNYSHRMFVASVDESLKKVKTDYIDLLLLHWPSGAIPLAEQIDSLNESLKTGRVRHIGVSNFNTDLMTRAEFLSERPLVTNQLEYHPYLDQSIVVAGTRAAGAAVTAHCGMAIGRVFSDPTLRAIAARDEKGVAQIVLRWLMQQDGVVALSRTTKEERVAENAAIFDFALTLGEMAVIHALAKPNSRIVSPVGLAPEWDPTDAGGLPGESADRARAETSGRSIKP